MRIFSQPKSSFYPRCPGLHEVCQGFSPVFPLHWGSLALLFCLSYLLPPSSSPRRTDSLRQKYFLWSMRSVLHWKRLPQCRSTGFTVCLKQLHFRKFFENWHSSVFFKGTWVRPKCLWISVNDLTVSLEWLWYGVQCVFRRIPVPQLTACFDSNDILHIYIFTNIWNLLLWFV